jgi:hypothetical protein
MAMAILVQVYRIGPRADERYIIEGKLEREGGTTVGNVQIVVEIHGNLAR